MKALRILIGSALMSGTIGGVYMALIWLLSEEHKAQLILEHSPKAALVVMFMWFVCGWTAANFITAAIVAPIEGALAFVFIHSLSERTIWKYEQQVTTVTRYDGSPAIDLTPTVIGFMLLTGVVIAIGVAVYVIVHFGIEDERNYQLTGHYGPKDSSLTTSGAVVPTTAATVIITMEQPRRR